MRKADTQVSNALLKKVCICQKHRRINNTCLTSITIVYHKKSEIGIATAKIIYPKFIVGPSCVRKYQKTKCKPSYQSKIK